MHITTDTLTSAVAITVGMMIGPHDKVFDWAADNGWGGVELYSEIGELAALSYTLANAVADCPDFKYDGFPGVYAYEVDEELGEWLAKAMREKTLPTGPETPPSLIDYPEVKHKLGSLATAYFDQAGCPIPYADAIIARMTGYVRGAA